ncbi:MAG TPA: ABC transporter permease [Fervidobacterium sp.]|nr:ABC transporter permease [Fervidobacterium sp.]HPV62972.1 ABC transporter permease [Fervidobacterium sp.]
MLKDALIIMTKELKNMFRDKRTIFATIILPLVLFPVMFGIIGLITKANEDAKAKAEYTVYVESTLSKSDELTKVIDEIHRVGNFEIINGKIDEKVIESDSTTVGLKVGKNGDIFVATVIYNSVKEKSTYAAQKIREALMNLNSELVSAELLSRGINPEELNFVQINDAVVGVSAENGNVEEAKAKGQFTQMLAMLVPYFLLLYIFAGSMGLGIDTTAGEKERGSLSILLVNQVSRTSIALGKILYLMLMSILTSVLNLVGLVIGLYLEMSFLGEANMPFSIELDAIGYLLLFITVILLALISSGIIIFIGILARSVKEASGYITPIYMIILLFGISTMQSEGSKAFYYYAIPFINIIFTMKDIFIGTFSVANFLTMLVVNSALVVLFVYLTAKIFNSEKVLEVTVE